MQGMVKSLVEKGLPAVEFWDLFIQCATCKFVMPRQYFPYYHPCVVKVIHSHLGLVVPNLPDFSLSSDFDEADLPGPALSDDRLGPDALLAIVRGKRQANSAEPVTPKAQASSTL